MEQEEYPELFLGPNDPDWDLNDKDDRASAAKMSDASLEGMKQAVQKIVNWEEVHSCFQREDGHPNDAEAYGEV